MYKIWAMAGCHYVTFLVVISCVCFGCLLSGKIVVGQTVESSDISENSTINQILMDSMSGPIEERSEGLIKIRGTEFYCTMETRYLDMNEHSIDEQTIEPGDIVNITFDSQTNNVSTVVLETKKTDRRPSIDNKQEKRKKQQRKNDVITFKNGVYTNAVNRK